MFERSISTFNMSDIYLNAWKGMLDSSGILLFPWWEVQYPKYMNLPQFP